MCGMHSLRKDMVFCLAITCRARNLFIGPILEATYLGGTSAETPGTWLAFDPTSGDVVVTHDTQSTNHPGTTGGAQPAVAGSNELYLAHMTDDPAQACGNGVLDSGETCDDAIRLSSDGCS